MSTLDNFFAGEIYVLDTDTTGLKGHPQDVIVDIAVCRVDLDKGTVDPVYSSVVGYDTSEWNEYRRNAWIFENTDMTLDMVDAAPPVQEVVADIRKLLRGKKVTSYNTEYDMGKFLYHEPWKMKDLFIECTDIMKAATPICKVPSQYYGRQYQYPKLDLAYEKIVEGDPAGIKGVQEHRAMSDAKVASHILVQLFRDRAYSP